MLQVFDVAPHHVSPVQLSGLHIQTLLASHSHEEAHGNMWQFKVLNTHVHEQDTEPLHACSVIVVLNVNLNYMTIWCEVKCLCCSAVQWWRCATGKAMLSYSKYWIWSCFVFIYLLPSSGCCWLFSSEAKFRPIVQCNFIIKVIGAEIWRAASSCCMHHCLNRSVSLEMLNLSFYCTRDKQWFV